MLAWMLLKLHYWSSIKEHLPNYSLSNIKIHAEMDDDEKAEVRGL
jgi:hypothetical protein